MNPLARAASVLAFLAVVLACGDNDDNPAPTPALTAPVAATPAPSVDPAPSAGATAALLQGTWTSTDDPSAIVRISGDQYTDVYGGAVVDTLPLVVASDTPENHGAPAPDGKTLWVGTGDDQLVYSIDALTDTELRLIYLARGNTLSYKRTP